VKYVLVDNDISAYSGKKRPGYEELLRLIESREIHTVIA
jgi:DNA invertase Pin-like site-specific DNA recombinase